MEIRRLFDYYQEVLQCVRSWNYYSNGSAPIDNVTELFESEKKSFEFVRAYLIDGGKEGLLLESLGKMSGRWTHTVSVFLLGIVIAREVFDIKFDQKDNKGNSKNLYLWYLACLYHDYGYLIENNKRRFPPCKMTLDSVLSKSVDKKESLQYHFPFDNAEFSNQLVNEYYDYNRIHCGFVNHGIVGGMIMYGELCRILEENIGCTDEAYRNGLHWYRGQEKDFATCANAIIAHNIWFDRQSPFSDLKFKGKERHTYKDWLTALLVLTDTIEPIKQFCCKPLNVLENLALEIKNDEIKIIWCGPDCYKIYKYLSRCKGINKWTNVKVFETRDSLIIRYLSSMY